jgi:hypothetical protein
MRMEFQTPAIYLRLLRTIALLVPKQFRSNWRREWEAEVISHWMQLEKWERLNAKSKFDLLRRIQGALRDVVWFQQRRTSLTLVTLNLVVALLTGFGALQEFIIGGILNRQMQPLFISLMAIFVSILFVICAVAMLRRWATARRLVIVTGTLSILLHVYGALPPHRIMGILVLIVGAGYGLLMLVVFEWNQKATWFRE